MRCRVNRRGFRELINKLRCEADRCRVPLRIDLPQQVVTERIGRHEIQLPGDRRQSRGCCRAIEQDRRRRLLSSDRLDVGPVIDSPQTAPVDAVFRGEIEAFTGDRHAARCSIAKRIQASVGLPVGSRYQLRGAVFTDTPKLAATIAIVSDKIECV